ncbi:MAG: hypothetical protein E4H40_02960 [Candidatus Brocadiia bacterium]|nr:MAG: hypothetical protein E4H40_02960 [Candidatus Brocadiia bacterium]
MTNLSDYRSQKLFDIPEAMKAMTLSGVGFEKLSLSEVPVPVPGPRQLLCRVDAAGVCTSLLKIISQGPKHSLINGWDIEKYPIILGDEGSLTVVKVGGDLKNSFRPGQRFGVQPAVDVPPINHRDRYSDNARNMKKCAVGYTLGGNLAEYLLITEEVLDGQCLIPLPDPAMPYFAVSMAEPISCVISAQQRNCHLVKSEPLSPRQPRLGLLQGGTAVVIGAGTMGAMHAELAMRFLPQNLIVADIVPGRLQKTRKNLDQKAQRLGIKLYTVPSEQLEQTVKKITGGSGADDVIIAVGIRSVQQEALKLLARAGVANLFGGLAQGQHILEVNVIDVHYNEIKIVGSSGGDPCDLKDALDAIAKKDIDAGNYVTAVGSLRHTSEVLGLIKENKILGRVILYPHIELEQLQFVEHWDIDKEAELFRQIM